MIMENFAKENLEFYEFVNNKLSKKNSANNEAAVSKFPKICKENITVRFGSKAKTNDLINIFNIYGIRYYNEQKK